MQKEFYYHFKTNYVWLTLNFLLLALPLSCWWCYPALLYWHQTWVLLATALFSFGLWGYKYLLKHRVVLADDESIKIDHCEPLKWGDIATAEYKTARCGFRKLEIIALHPRENLEYPYNPLQKWCDKMDFTAFSVPLYALTAEDGAEIGRIIAQKVK